MNRDMDPDSPWARLASGAGLAAVACYFGAAFLPLPDVAARLLAFAFGPLLMVSFLGIYRYLSRHRDGPLLQSACLLGMVAGAMVTLMLVVQIGNNMVRADQLASAEAEAAAESVRLAWRAVNRVQYLVDVVWDIFICAATMLLGAAVMNHPDFGRLWGSLGVLAGALLLALNLQTFPEAPAYAGSVDVGPLVALWMAAVFVRLLMVARATR